MTKAHPVIAVGPRQGNKLAAEHHSTQTAVDVLVERLEVLEAWKATGGTPPPPPEQTIPPCPKCGNAARKWGVDYFGCDTFTHPSIYTDGCTESLARHYWRCLVRGWREEA
jgi:hypothetical protein